MLAMVAGQPVEPHNDMYCSQYDYYADYYQQAAGAGGPGGPPPPPGAQPPPPPQQQQQPPPPQAQQQPPPPPQHHEMCPAAGVPPMCAVHDAFHGPVTVPMVSTNSTPPIPMPVQVPPGHVVQQIVDEIGTLRHIILSPQAMVHLPPAPFGLAPGFPPHFGPSNPLQTGVMAHVSPPAQPGHSPPPHSFHKDERTQRQYNKLKKKLEQKQMRGETLSIGSSQSTPPVSPRRELVNGMRRGGKDRMISGRSSVGTSEDGEESSSVQDEEEEANLIIERLSMVKSPVVSELTPRSALLHWVQPEPSSDACMEGKVADIDLSEAGLRYEVLLSDKGKEGKYKSIYNGVYLSCRIQDLRPGTEYSVCLQVHCDELTGSASEPTTFVTPPCEPDTPLPPKMFSRSRTHLSLRWNAPVDNGSQITQYILEFDEGKGKDFVEVYKNRGKQHKVMKLQDSTCYRFRLAAVNECGKSTYSDVVQFSTSGSPPAQPAAPVLKEASVTSLHLAWQRRPNDEEFTLQMDDMESGHGFLPIYSGKEQYYIRDGLHRHTLYKFRLRAVNEEGSSQWSDEVCYRTLPGRPAAPPRPSLKGRIFSQGFKVKWEPPSDRGGADITTYVLEMRHSGRAFEEVYRGPDTEYICDRLMPGTTYDLRVSCISAGGHSERSDICHITTEPVCPRQCPPPRAHGKPRATSLALKWGPPEYDGGAPIQEFEVMITSPDLTRQVVFKGNSVECAVTDLSPGQVYVFQVRAFNRAGAGPWSEKSEIVSGAAPPNTPEAPVAQCRSAHSVLVQWEEPPNNGAIVTDYRLEMSSSEEEQDYNTVFHGLATSYEAKGLTPAMPYYFRVQASNSAGWSSISPSSMVLTPPATPAVVTNVRYTATHTSLILMWNEPTANGSPILHYNIEIGGDRIESSAGPDLQHAVESLQPDTTYKCRVQAVNGVGPGPFSAPMKAVTPALPPAAPRLECVGVGHNYLKLKWGDGRNPNFTQYHLEMQTPWSKEFQTVYQGNGHTYKVGCKVRLQELTTFRFRICAANDDGQGDWSEPVEYSTCIALPPSLKAPRICEIQQRSCVVEWAPCKPIGSDPLQYQVQLARVRDQDYKQVYRGSDTKAHLTDLDPGTEYHVRVCPIRQAASGDLMGAYSPPGSFSTTALEPTVSPSMRNTSSQAIERKPLTDQQWAAIIVAGFTIFALMIAMVVQQVVLWSKRSQPDS
ncbi:hypothetical protein R5R35_006188 [Gryllus longicercus]|uniref:Fibronectin type-III domain-containing protein n=1 Tax=Gryllus longicercus TaxID=2509291 RepID=A0AAN9VIA8_9ORTH